MRRVPARRTTKAPAAPIRIPLHPLTPQPTPIPIPHPHSDIPTKEFILSLNAARPADAKFVVADLDDTRLFVDPAAVPELQAAVRARGDELTYTAPSDPTAG